MEMEKKDNITSIYKDFEDWGIRLKEIICEWPNWKFTYLFFPIYLFNPFKERLFEAPILFLFLKHCNTRMACSHKLNSQPFLPSFTPVSSILSLNAPCLHISEIQKAQSQTTCKHLPCEIDLTFNQYNVQNIYIYLTFRKLIAKLSESVTIFTMNMLTIF